MGLKACASRTNQTRSFTTQFKGTYARPVDPALGPRHPNGGLAVVYERLFQGMASCCYMRRIWTPGTLALTTCERFG